MSAENNGAPGAPGPLTGVRITELTMWQQGPVAGAMLGDLGAEIIKIEDRVTGDAGRGALKIAGVPAGLAGRNAYFEMNNRNKRGITLDLRKESGREIVHKLVQRSDVFLTNFRREVLTRLKVDYDSLSQYNPKLIYAVGSAWGRKGPDADKMSMDFTGVARSGIMTAVGEPDTPPSMITGAVGDQMGAIGLAYSVLAALFARERTGMGQEVESSILGSMMMLQGVSLALTLVSGHEVRRLSRRAAANPLWNFYQCKDGKWIVLACAQADRFWPSVCAALGIDNLQHDPRFSGISQREENCEALVTILDGVFAGRDRDEWLAILEQYDIICGKLNSIPDLVVDPQALANDYIIDYAHPTWGNIKMLGFPFSFSRMQPSIRRAAPEHGQHTEEVLLELGYSWDDITRLREEETI